jgi:hypothetical protein
MALISSNVGSGFGVSSIFISNIEKNIYINRADI